MKKVIILLLSILLLIMPNSIRALTEDQARKAITNYAYYIYNEKKNDISYVNPSEVNQEKIFLGYKTQNNTYAMDCNAFVGFVVYNAFRIEANEKGGINQPSKGDGYLNSSGRVALNGVNGWSTHSSYYNSKMYSLRQGEKVQDAVKRINLEARLKPGDLIGIVGYSEKSYANQDSSNKSAHIMIYVGDGKYIHNRSDGVSLDTLSSISYGNRVGSSFPDSKGDMGPHGSITILTLQNYDKIPTSVLNGYRYPDEKGNLVLEKVNNNTNNNSNNSNKQKNGHWEYVVDGLHLCEREDTAPIVKAVNLLLQIIRISVPIVLIISLSIGFAKAVSKPDELEKIKKSSIAKMIAAVLIFLIPTFVSIITRLVGFEVSFNECIAMSKDPKPIKYWVEDPAEAELVKNGVYIMLTSEEVTGYYFSKKKEELTENSASWIPSTKNTIDFILLPGKYYIYIRTEKGIVEKEVEVNASDIIVTNNVKDITFLTTDLDKYLLSKGSSLSEFNEAMARSVSIAGIYSKDGAAAASLALTQMLYIKYKIKIPYGNTHGNHIQIGAIGSWGSSNIYGLERDGNMLHQGMHCGGFVAWSYAQANFDMNPGIGSNATLCRWRYGSYTNFTSKDRGSIGDTLTYARSCEQSVHVAVINAIDDKGYYLTEANAITGSVDGHSYVYENIGIVTTYNKFGERWHGYLDMSPTVQYHRNKKSIPSGF